MNLFDVLFAKKLSGGGSPFPPVIKRVTGNPVEFTDGADAPLVKCVTQITGSQDLHGYDKPWVGGAGKNKIPMTVDSLKAKNTFSTWVGNTYTYRGVTFEVLTNSSNAVIGIKTSGASDEALYFFLANSKTYEAGMIISGCPAGGDSSKYGVGLQSSNYYWSYGPETALGTDATGVAAIWFNTGYPNGTMTFYPMIRPDGTDATFAPYSNICPITAYTEGEIEVRGKNALDTSTVTIRGITFTQDADGYVTASPNNSDPGAWSYNNSQYKTSLQPGAYSLIVEVDTISANVNADAKIFDSEGNTILSLPPATAFASLGIKRYDFTINTKLNIGVMIKQYDAVARFMLVKSTDSSTYEPYTSATHTTTYPSAIYQGSEDCVNGEVKSDWTLDDMGDYTWTKDGLNRFVYIGLTNKIKKTTISEPLAHAICSSYPIITANQSATQIDGIAVDTAGNVFVYDSTKVNMSAVDFKTAIAGQGFAYELATPTTSSVTTTNLPIKSLSGYNHIESSTGEMEIDYITDAYQNFVDTTERAVPSTRKGGVKAFDIFKTLDEPKTPEAPAEGEPEEKETEEDAKR